MKAGSQFDAGTQYSIIASLTALIKEYGGEKGCLNVDLVNHAIRNAYLTVKTSILSASYRRRRTAQRGHCTHKHVQKPRAVDKAKAVVVGPSSK